MNINTWPLWELNREYWNMAEIVTVAPRGSALPLCGAIDPSHTPSWSEAGATTAVGAAATEPPHPEASIASEAATMIPIAPSVSRSFVRFMRLFDDVLMASP